MTTTEITTMNPEIKDLWTTALRSGEFAQGRSYLRMGDKYCCLGVLCHLAGQAGVIESRPMFGDYEDEYYDEETGEAYGGMYVPDEDGRWDYGQPDGEEVLPRDVQDWAGLVSIPGDTANPMITVPDEIMPQLSPGVQAQVRAVGDTFGRPGTISLAQLNDAEVPFSVIANIIDAAL